MANRVFILYVDHQRHPAPLTECYHATASRRLSSSVHRHPPSTTTEIDSAFCPQCLSFYDVGTAASSNLGFCPKPSCRRCPLCLSVAAIVVEEEIPDECLYKCGYCDWTSRACKLTMPIGRNEEGFVSREQLEITVEALGEELNRRRREANQPTEDLYASILNAWVTEFKAMESRQPSETNASTFAWSIDSLEESIRSKREKSKIDASTVMGGRQLENISLTERPRVDPSLENVTTRSILWQAIAASKMTNSIVDLLPLPMPLRSRKSKRCRAEIAEGRPGILLKTKLNPLEGDSSLRTGHGKWFKKDSSALHVVPKVRVVKHMSNQNKHTFLLSVKNPTLGIVRFRLGCSSYLGEPAWNENEPNPILENVLIDTISMTRRSVALRNQWTEALQATPLIELESLEDTSLELAKARPDEPVDILTWNGLVPESDRPSSLRLVAQQSDTAWVELVVTGDGLQYDEEKDNAVVAVPLAMDVEVGNGSWEYSLIKPKSVEDGLNDFVTLDILVVWDIQ